MEFAKMESDLRQIKQARAILVHGAQTAGSRRLPEYLKAFIEFKIANGFEETIREMLQSKEVSKLPFQPSTTTPRE
jgi:hypothetical protein